MSSQRKGRPPGSPNLKYAEVAHIPDHCPKCKGTELKIVPGSKVIVRQIAGKLPSGFAYKRISWTRKQCACGQYLVVRTFIPAPPEN